MAITPEIERACKKVQVGARISLHDRNGQLNGEVAHMLEQRQIGVEGGSKLAIYHLDEMQRMFSFTVYQVTDYSDYMTESIWNEVEVRVVCLVEEFSVPAEAYPPNIFNVFSY